ncbi:MAG: YfcE family phosphodiesterase [Deltaproteobacteria bacterium]|nr:YfcE family phosphodiesterase [Deltaproteobacteria bacterium]
MVRVHLGIISDVHADLHALRDALAQLERLGCDAIVCAGDLLDWGLFPEQTIALLREARIPCIRGNHDRWAVAECQDASGWDLTSRAVRFLDGLPTSWRRTIEGVRVVVWHARPGNDMDGIYPDQTAPDELLGILERADADVLVVGHTHLPFCHRTRRGLVVNPGALLRDPAVPLDIPTGGTFGLLRLPSLEFSVHAAADGRRLKSWPARRRITRGVM